MSTFCIVSGIQLSCTLTSVLSTAENKMGASVGIHFNTVKNEAGLVKCVPDHKYVEFPQNLKQATGELVLETEAYPMHLGKTCLTHSYTNFWYLLTYITQMRNCTKLSFIKMEKESFWWMCNHGRCSSISNFKGRFEHFVKVQKTTKLCIMSPLKWTRNNVLLRYEFMLQCIELLNSYIVI